LGFHFHGTAIDAISGLAVLVALAAAMSALFGRIGDRMRRPDVVQFAGMMLMMPFMFVSSAFAPLDTMPGWMQAVATLNPVSHATDALRGSVFGTLTVGDTVTALLAAAALWVAVTVVPSFTARRRSGRVAAAVERR
jgi:ABC-2 type transport system permease protein